MKKNKCLNLKRGDIVYAKLPKRLGSEQDKNHPLVVIQNNKGNKFSPTIIVAFITSQVNKNKLPTHVLIEDYKKSNLKKESVILLEQITTIDKLRIKKYIGKLDDETMKAVDEALLISLDIKK